MYQSKLKNYAAVLQGLLTIAIVYLTGSASSVELKTSEHSGDRATNSTHCGYLNIRTLQKKVDIFESQALSQITFSEIYKNLKNASVIVENDNCNIEICGHPTISLTKKGAIEPGCTSYWTSVETLPSVPFGEYEASSISCGCKKNRPDCDTKKCSTATLPNNICATLYQVKNCSECVYNGIDLENGAKFSSNNFVVVRSLYVQPGCIVTQTAYGYSAYDPTEHKDQSFIPYKRNYSGSSEIQPSYTRRGEEYDCYCVPSSSTNLAENSIATTNSQFLGSTETNFVNSVEPVYSYSVTTLVVILVGIGAVFGTGFAILYYLYFRSKRRSTILPIKDIKRFKKGLDGQQLDEIMPTTGLSQAYRAPYDKKFEIAIEHIKFSIWDPESVLGSGVFGIVYKGTLHTFDKNRFRDVAVKTVKPFTDAGYLQSILNEIKLLAYIGYHPNIVYFIGACTSNLRGGEVFIILELCVNGSLDKFLKSQKKSLPRSKSKSTTLHLHPVFAGYCVYDETEGNDSNGQEEQLVPEISQSLFNQLIKWAKEIAAGMKHLEEKDVLHVDLATRNILLTEDLTAKVGDFGLSRKLYAKLNYRKEGKEPVPMKGNALESLTENKYSVKSDVWAYGVTLWEIFSLGDEPYEDFTHVQIINYLNSGSRLECPSHATPEIYGTMFRCWNKEPSERPCFTEMIEYFDKMLSNYEYEIIND